MKKLFFILLVLHFALYPHPGRLDKNGGHYNRKTGTYHYHRSTTTPKPASSTKPKEDLASRKGIYTADNKMKIEILENGNAKLSIPNDKEYSFKIGEPASTSANFLIPMLSIDKEYKNVKFIFTGKDTFTVELNTSIKYKFTKQK